MVDYEQRNSDALFILDEVMGRGVDHWVEDPWGLYTHLNQVTMCYGECQLLMLNEPFDIPT